MTGLPENDCRAAPRRSRLVDPLVALALCAIPVVAIGQEAASEPPVRVELNKLEPVQDGCRSFLVIDNTLDADVEALTLDVVVFDVDAIIARRLAVGVAPLAAGRTAVKAFDLSGVACERVGRLLLNGVLACDAALRSDGGGGSGCRDAVATTSRAEVPFDG